MPKIKNIIIPAVIGFVLSFFISIIAAHKLGIALLRAVIFGAVFAAIGFGIDFIYNKFLSDGSEGHSSIDLSSKIQKSSGNIVDITVDDENFSEDDNAPSFVVSQSGFEAEDKISSLESPAGVSFAKSGEQENSSVQGEPLDNAGDSAVNPLDSNVEPKKDLKQEIIQQNMQSNAQESFKPVQLGTPVNETPINDAPINEPSSSKSKTEELDMLPDIGDLAMGAQASSGGAADDEVVLTSDFAQASSEEDIAMAKQAASDSAKAPDQDAKTIASAIRTLLVKDE